MLLQAVRLCNSRAFPSRIAAVAVGLLLYLANTPAAHPYLAQPEIVGGLVEGCLFRMKEAVGGLWGLAGLGNDRILML